jgi:hypothetical protein
LIDSGFTLLFYTVTWTSRGENGGEKFLESIRESYLIQHVTEVTRVRDNSEPSILDLILTNEENMIDEIIYSNPLGSSDHCGLEFVFKCYYELKENKSERWNYFKGVSLPTSMLLLDLFNSFVV